jgi:hypothetical protein
MSSTRRCTSRRRRATGAVVIATATQLVRHLFQGLACLGRGVPCDELGEDLFYRRDRENAESATANA